MLEELTSRPDRLVDAWLAFVPASEAVGHRVSGLISLIRCRSATGIRHSIGWLLVHPEVRRRGVARAMVSRVCRRARQFGANTVWVECRSDWVEAMGFWRAVGFKERPRDSNAVMRALPPDH